MEPILTAAVASLQLAGLAGPQSWLDATNDEFWIAGAKIAHNGAQKGPLNRKLSHNYLQIKQLARWRAALAGSRFCNFAWP